jgi:hypothetical protein
MANKLYLNKSVLAMSIPGVMRTSSIWSLVMHPQFRPSCKSVRATESNGKSLQRILQEHECAGKADGR